MSTAPLPVQSHPERAAGDDRARAINNDHCPSANVPQTTKKSMRGRLSSLFYSILHQIPKYGITNVILLGTPVINADTATGTAATAQLRFVHRVLPRSTKCGYRKRVCRAQWILNGIDFKALEVPREREYTLVYVYVRELVSQPVHAT